MNKFDKKNESIKLYVPNSHDAHFVFHTLEAGNYLSQDLGAPKFIKIIFLPVRFTIRENIRTLIHTKCKKITFVAKMLYKVNYKNLLLLKINRKQTKNELSIYNSLKIYKYCEISKDKIKFELTIEPIDLLLFFRLWLMTTSKVIKIRLSLILMKRKVDVQDFLKAEFKGTRFGDLLAATILRKNPKLGGQFNMRFVKGKDLHNAIAIINFTAKKFYNSDATYILVHEPAYIEALYKRILCKRGFYLLESNNYKQPFKLIKSQAEMSIPWVAKNNPEIPESKEIEEYFLMRLHDIDSKLWYMRPETSNNNNETRIKDFFGKYLEFNSNPLSVVVCLHSFDDAQYAFGIDTFDDIVDWTETALNEACKNESVDKVFVKPHPNGQYFSKSSDKYGLLKLINKFGDYKKITFLDSRTSLINLSLQTKLFAITHHGSIAEEFCYLNVPTIASTHSPWSNLYHFAQLYEDKKDLEIIIAAISHSNFDKYIRDKRELFRFVNEYRLKAIPWHERSLSERFFSGDNGLPRIDKSDYEARNKYWSNLSQNSPQFSKLWNVFDDILRRYHWNEKNP